MSSPSKRLLGQIEDGALDSETPLADLLRKCVALGGRAGSEELRDWARRELDGYGDGQLELPIYRIVPAVICIDGEDPAKRITGQQISTFELPEVARDTIKAEAPIAYGVAQLQLLVGTKEAIQLQDPRMPDLVLLMNQDAPYGTSIHRMYWRVATTSIHGILDTIRTTLVALVAEMRAAGVDDEPDAAAASQAVHVVLKNAKRTTVNVNTNQASGGASPASQNISVEHPAHEVSRIPVWIRGPWGFAIGAATIAGGVAAVAASFGWNPFG